MAALPTALPKAPFGGGEDSDKQEYLAALQQVMESLQMRQQPNLFSIAGALLDPGRTGNVGEAFGRASSELGRQQALEQQMAPSIATMKAQIAAQKYEMGNQAKATQLLAGVLGVPPNAVQEQLQPGNVTPDTMQKLSQVYPMVAQLSPKHGEILKGVFNMQNDLRKNAIEDFKAGMNQAELVAKYGPGILSLIPGGGRATGAAPAGATEPQPVPQAPVAPLPQTSPAQTEGPTPSPMETAQLQQQDKQLREQLRATNPADTTRISELNTALDQVQKRLAQLGIKTPSIALAQPGAVGTSDTSGLPLAAQAQIAQKRVEEGDKPYNMRRDEILTYTPQLLESSNTNLRQLDFFARTKPQIFALMQQQGFISGLLTAAQQGAQLTVGDFNARLGLPVKDFLEKVKLPTEDQQTVRDVTRILGSEFLANVKANKGLLGVNPTDNDARLLQAPMATTDDSARAVQHWARQQILLNKQREALYGAWSNYSDQTGAAASPRNFFKPGSPYEKINKDYATYRMQLFKQFHPGE